MEAQQQKQLQARQSAVVFSQHHHIHLVRVSPLRTKLHRKLRVSPPLPRRLHPPPPQKREKRKEEEQRRKEWVDQEREKTLSRLRSFREVRPSYCLTSCQPSPRDSFYS